jgi:redox-sensing transcriptional repressor
VSNQIPVPVIRRLTKYLAHLQRVKQTGKEWVSSQELARALSLTDSTVRQDLSHLEFSGRAKRGYEVDGLKKTLTTVLGLDTESNAVIIGAGNMGRALALHEEFRRQGFRICGVFDFDTKLFGKKLGPLVVQSMDVLPDVVRKEGVSIGIIAVPPPAAQEVAGELVAAGVRGLLNLACAHVSVPDDVAIVDGRLVESLQELSCAIKMQGGAR